MAATAADRNLLFGLLALQNGLIDQVQLVAAFQAWTREKALALADHLISLGHLNEAQRAVVEAMAELHVAKHGNVERSLAAIPAGPSTRESLARIEDRDVGDTLANLGSALTHPGEDADRTASYAVGEATSEGQRFRVLRPHARGGLGAVFVALDAELNREVALKQILDHHADDPTSRHRFLLEAEVTGGLEHPGIVPVYGLGTYGDGRPFYAMRFIRGDSLKEAIEHFHVNVELKKDTGRRSLELRKLLRRFLDVSNAIEYAHSRGVLHRDIKPGNIVVGRHGETLVVDWGLAKAGGPSGDIEPGDERPLIPSSASGSAETLPGSALGTPAYMSPEQARGELDRLGPRSDVYSLGATLYCLLTGNAPVVADDIGEILRKVQRGDFTRPRQLDPSIDRALEAVCLKAMATRPEDRYDSCRALAEDIERWTADEPVSAYREPVSRRAQRWAKRHRSLVVAAAMLLVSAVVGLTVGAVLINRERARAEANFRQARAAVDEYFTTVSESKLLDVPGLQPLRKELLDAARRYYQDFLRERGNDASVRAEAASALFRVGWIAMTVGRAPESLEPLRTATAMYEELARARPEDSKMRRLVATGYGAQGLLLADLGRPDDAIAAHRKALSIREGLARAQPGDVLIANDVSRTHRNIGGLHRAAGRPAEALADWAEAVAIAKDLMTRSLPRGGGAIDLTGRSDPSAIVREDLANLQLDRASLLRDVGRLVEAQASWRESRDLLEALVREEPDSLRLRGRLSAACEAGASILVDLGRLPEARTLLERGVEIAEGLAAGNPTVLAWRSALVDMLMKLGWVLRTLGQTPDALRRDSRGIELAEKLVADRPDASGFRGLLARCLTHSGNHLLALGRPGEAVSRLRRALAILEELARAQPDAESHAGDLAYSLRGVGRAEAAVGRPALALAAFERASELDLSLAAKYPGTRYNLACSLALMVPVAPPERRDELARRAVEALRLARAAGFANFANIQTDEDLAALRDRPDFREFLLDMAFPTEPFAGLTE